MRQGQAEIDKTTALINHLATFFFQKYLDFYIIISKTLI